LKSVSICAALILAVAAFADSAEARQGGFSGGRSMGGFHGGRSVGGFHGARMSGFSGTRAMSIAGPGRMGMAPARYGTLGNRGIYRTAGTYGQWQGRGNWSGGKWAGGTWQGGRWHGGRWHGGRFWPWGVGVGAVALAASWPYYAGYGYGYDSCVRWVPDYGWVNVCDNPYYGGYGYY
jgi:hypothetical protein